MYVTNRGPVPATLAHPPPLGWSWWAKAIGINPKNFPHIKQLTKFRLNNLIFTSLSDQKMNFDLVFIT